MFVNVASFGALVALLFSGSTVEATPNGAGGCSVGNILADDPLAAPHQKANTLTGPLSDKFQVFIDDEEVFAGVPKGVDAATPHTIELRADPASVDTFRGFLIRVSDADNVVDTTTYLSNQDATAKVLDLCTDDEGVGGVTHTNNSTKTSVIVDFTPEVLPDTTANPLNFDITMVVSNSVDTSEFYYSRFNVISSSEVATPSPAPFAGTPTPSLETTGTPAPSLESTGTPAPSLGSTGTPAPSLGSTGTPAPSLGSTGTPSPSLGSTGTPSPSLGSTGTPSPSLGSTGTPSPSPGTATAAPTMTSVTGMPTESGSETAIPLSLAPSSVTTPQPSGSASEAPTGGSVIMTPPPVSTAPDEPTSSPAPSPTPTDTSAGYALRFDATMLMATLVTAGVAFFI